MLLVVLFTVEDPDAPAVATPKVLLVVELADCDPLEEDPVEEEATEPDAPDVLTAVCATLSTNVAVLTVPFTLIVAKVVFPVPAEVVELPLLLDPPVPAAVPEL